MDPLSITFGAIGVAGVGGHLIQSTRDFAGNYRDAHAQIEHAKSQLAIVQSTLKDKALQSNSKCSGAQSSFEAISEKFPKELRSDNRSARFLWTAKHKRHVSGLVNQLKETEISSTFALQLEQSEEIEKIKSSLSEIMDQLEGMRQQHLEGKIHTHIESMSMNLSAPPRRHDQAWKTKVTRWNTPLSNYLGADASLISYRVNGENRYKAFLRWRVLRSTVLSSSIGSAWPSWLSWSLDSRFEFHNILPANSLAVEACRRNDVLLMREVLSSGKARPNDKTTENHTLLHLAIRHNAFDTIQLLLESGADPNLPCGRWETSPLQTAFYTGHVETVRLLLDSKAELEYTNLRMWTSPRYIFDPLLTKLHTIELLDICAARDFDQWDAQDVVGWTIFHRASAFGQASDIQKLLNLRASSNIYTSTLNWLPIFCAVKFGNESTFEFLVDLIHPWTLPTLKDSRGWSLLHLAAENGSEPIMTQLLRRGLDPLARTDQSTMALPEGLSLMELTPSDIAGFYSHQDVYERALNSTGYFMMSKQQHDEISLKEEG